MPLIKLDAIDSTNNYLKQLARETDLENFTVVLANEQTNGKGQMGAKWVSEKGKNLVMSILVKNIQLKNHNTHDFNITVAVSMLNVLKNIQIPNVSIKWPNDIMAENKKLAGILIENTIKSDGTIDSIIGIGLNLNQINFENLPQATSLCCITNKNYNIEETALLLKNSLVKFLIKLDLNPDLLWDEYHSNLYKINYPTAFEDKQRGRFMGIIKKVTPNGQLQVQLEDDSITHFEVKEVKLLY